MNLTLQGRDLLQIAAPALAPGTTPSGACLSEGQEMMMLEMLLMIA